MILLCVLISYTIYRYACGNSKLMNGILKDELGFQGFVQSDWLAQRSGVASALAGLYAGFSSILQAQNSRILGT